jgi:spermidine synthase
LGVTTAATGTVVATYLGGLALGSGLGARWLGRSGSKVPETAAFRAYGLLELGIGLYGLAFPSLLSWVSSRFLEHSSWSEGGLLFLLLRAAVCAIVILPPTVAMGATLPFLSRYAAGRAKDPATAASLLYFLNTLGGVLGAAAAGWGLLPSLGLFASSAVAASLNFLVGLTAVLLKASGDPAPPETRPPPGAPPAWIFPAFALSGAGALLCEIAWTQGLVLSLGSSVYAFSLVLTSILLGFAAGGAGGVYWASRAKDPLVQIGILELATALLASATVIFLEWLPVVMIKWLSKAPQISGALLLEALVAGLVVLVPAALMGALFPIFCRMAVESRQATGAAVGRLLSWNTAGNIAGALGASFVLLPWLGVPGTLLTAAGIHGLVGAWAFRRAPSAGRLIPWATLGGTALLVALVPGWDLKRVSTSPIMYASAFARQTSPGEASPTVREIAERLGQAGQIVFHRWDGTGLVTVHRERGELFLRINGKTDASNLGDMRTQIMVAHVPLLLHRDPREVLVIGVGSGATVAAALRHPVEHVDAVEISPGVLEASALFESSVGLWRENPRLKVHLADARTYMLGTSRRYDLIAAQPSNLWVSGMATLFTREHFERYRAALKPGGMVCQWLHGYLLPPEVFAAVVATFRSVFPRSSLWEIGLGSDYLLLGPLEEYVPAARAAQRFERIAGEMKSVGFASFDSLLHDWMGGPELLAAIGGQARRITDDDCYVEYSAPRGLLRKTPWALLASLDEARSLGTETLAGGPDLREARLERRLLAQVPLAGERDGALAALDRLAKVLGKGQADPLYQPVVEGVSQVALNQAMERSYRGDRAGARDLLERIPKESQVYTIAYGLLRDLSK